MNCVLGAQVASENWFLSWLVVFRLVGHDGTCERLSLTL